ncbi:MAG: radical SAM protein [Planctomycetota bacterium]|nr:radical SAM protein [Planctomycetota bacterium]
MLRYLPFVTRGLRAAGPPIHLTVYVTGQCNLRCRHCFHWREVAAGVPGPALADLQRLADSTARMGPLLWVSLGGGEPFLRKDLVEVASAFARHGLRHLAIPTNGLLPERAEAFAEEVLGRHPDLHLSLSISFDGPPAIHDAIRDVEGGHARSMECVRRLKKLQERLPRLGVGVLVCVTRENQDALAAHVEELVRDLSPDNVTVNLARGDALDRALLDVDVARYEEVVAAKKTLQRSGLLPYFDFPMARVAKARDEMMYEHVARVARGENDSKHLPCTAASISAVVFENGEVRACEMLPDAIGNLNEVGWDLEKLWNAQAARDLRQKIEATRCACTWECAQADNVLFNARAWPELAWRAARG